MSRQLLVQGKGPDGRRTSVSIHSVLASTASDRYASHTLFLSHVRRMIAVGDDSWAVSAWLIEFIADPKQVALFDD